MLARIGKLLWLEPIEKGGPGPEVPLEDLPAGTNPATVEALLENLRVLVAYEEERLNSLTTRGSALAGFAGVGTVVIAAGTDEALPLGVKVLLLLAAIGLVFVVAGVVLGMLATRTAIIQSTQQVSLYRQPGYQRVSPARVQVQMIDILITRLGDLRRQNFERATWLNRSGFALVLAVFLSAAGAALRLFL